MKKLILTCSVVAIAVGAFAQGAVTGFGGAAPYVSFGVGNTTEFDSSLYSGGLTMQIFFSSTATSGEVSAINAFNGVLSGAASAQSLFAADGFTSVASTVTGLTANGMNNNVTGFGTYNLSSAFAAGTVGYYAFLFTATSGAASGYSSVIASGNGTSGGGNYGVQTPGTPYNIGSGSTFATYLSTKDIDLTPTPTPEPASMVLAGLGGLSLLALRRKK